MWLDTWNNALSVAYTMNQQSFILAPEKKTKRRKINAAGGGAG
jgi:hypothetical protein